MIESPTDWRCVRCNILLEHVYPYSSKCRPLKVPYEIQNSGLAGLELMQALKSLLACNPCCEEYNEWENHRSLAIHYAVPSGGYADLVEISDDPYFNPLLLDKELVEYWLQENKHDV
jgi:hypothetical protein